MELIFKHGRIFLITMTIINGIVFKYRSKKYIVENPELEDGYDKLFKGWLLWGNIPWIIMAIGDLTKITDGIGEYFNPRLLNPMVLIFHTSILLIWIIGSKWIYLEGGSELLAKHPGLIQFHGFGTSKDITSSSTIKIIWTLCIIGGIIGMFFMWTMKIPSMNY
jgi:hypothetical protein